MMEDFLFALFSRNGFVPIPFVFLSLVNSAPTNEDGGDFVISPVTLDTIWALALPFSKFKKMRTH